MNLSTRGLLRAGGRLLCVVLAGGLPRLLNPLPRQRAKPNWTLKFEC